MWTKRERQEKTNKKKWKTKYRRIQIHKIKDGVFFECVILSAEKILPIIFFVRFFSCKCESYFIYLFTIISINKHFVVVFFVDICNLKKIRDFHWSQFYIEGARMRVYVCVCVLTHERHKRATCKVMEYCGVQTIQEWKKSSKQQAIEWEQERNWI